MITLITGVPGSGKTLHAVSELLLPMQGAEIEHEGGKVTRVLHTNIKNLLLDHVLIGKEELLTWDKWAKPGDLICFDEVQEVWRPRALSVQAPESITNLEIHRHMAVDFVIITQHPMLLDQNIRRLVGRHLHVRRVANMGLAVVYEWDHASNPSMVKSAITTRPWRYPKSAYKLYKSAEAHTKQPRRLPAALLVLLAAAVGLAYGLPTVYGRMNERFNGVPAGSAVAGSKAVPPTGGGHTPAVTLAAVPAPVRPLGAASSAVVESPPPPPVGCLSTATRCSCFDQAGMKIPLPDKACRTASVELVYFTRSAGGGSVMAASSTPPSSDKQ